MIEIRFFIILLILYNHLESFKRHANREFGNQPLKLQAQNITVIFSYSGLNIYSQKGNRGNVKNKLNLQRNQPKGFTYFRVHFFVSENIFGKYLTCQ